MKNLKELQKEIDAYEKELTPIYKERDRLDDKILELVNKRDDVINKMNIIQLRSIPNSTPKKITKEQWKWLLHIGNNEGEVKYKARKAVLESLGFFAFGFYPDNNQPVLSILSSDMDKLKKGFKIIAPHLKPVTVKDNTTETGIRIQVTNLESDMTSVLYVHKNKKCTLYITKFETKKFDSFDDFIDWYKIKVNK